MIVCKIGINKYICKKLIKKMNNPAFKPNLLHL